MKRLAWLMAACAAAMILVPSCSTTSKQTSTATETPVAPTNTSTPTPTFAKLSYGAVMVRANQIIQVSTWFDAIVANTSPTGTPITNATVMINGVLAPWDTTTNTYHLTPVSYNPGTVATVTINVPPQGGVWGFDPGVGSVMLPGNVSVTQPALFSSHSASASMTWAWTQAGANPQFYALTALANDNPVPPPGGLPTQVPGSSLSYVVPANSLYLAPGTPVPQNAICAMIAGNSAVIQGSYEAAQSVPTPSFAGLNGSGTIISLQP